MTAFNQGQHPSLLIVVPTLNSHSLLPSLLLSLQKQSWSFWHLLFVDGASEAAHRQWIQQCCARDCRCSWIEQKPDYPGIFGAMNQAFEYASTKDWMLFWGSDDWAASPTALEDIMNTVGVQDKGTSSKPDLVVCRGRYVDSSGRLNRSTAFSNACFLGTKAYRRALLLGSTPPHQATLFGPGSRSRLARYSPGFRLSADLDYFLQLSNHPGLQVRCLDLELVHMADGGISGQQTQQRLQEVRHAYRRAFGWLWWLPFIMRYLKRLFSVLECRH